jgi:hypothetical protein
MNSKIVSYRFAALLVLVFGVLSIGADNGCLDSTPTNTDLNGPGCCPAGTQRYVCGVQVNITGVALMGGSPKSDTRCFAAPRICAMDLVDATNQAKGYAAANYANGMQIVTMETVTCKLVAGPCGQGGLQVQDFEGACMFVETTPSSSASSTSGGPACLANSSTCSTNTECCSGMCSDWNACESCRQMSEGCADNAECCSGLCAINGCGGQ